jgi:hypothetical protein
MQAARFAANVRFRPTLFSEGLRGRRRPQKRLKSCLQRRKTSLTFRRSVCEQAVGLVAQLVEQCPFKALVVGSSPTQPTTSKVSKSPCFQCFR